MAEKKKRGRSPGFKMTEEHRTKIAKSRILGNLIKFAEGDDAIITKAQADIGLGLLKKVMPDLSTITLQGDADKPLAFEAISLAPLTADDAAD